MERGRGGAQRWEIASATTLLAEGGRGGANLDLYLEMAEEGERISSESEGVT